MIIIIIIIIITVVITMVLQPLNVIWHGASLSLRGDFDLIRVFRSLNAFVDVCRHHLDNSWSQAFCLRISSSVESWDVSPFMQAWILYKLSPLQPFLFCPGHWRSSSASLSKVKTSSCFCSLSWPMQPEGQNVDFQWGRRTMMTV